MQWDQLPANWPKMRNQLRHRWGRLSEDDLDLIAGQEDIFISRVQDRYSIDREESRHRIEEWLRALREDKFLTGRA